jgi:hypothetical protein
LSTENKKKKKKKMERSSVEKWLILVCSGPVCIEKSCCRDTGYGKRDRSPPSPGKLKSARANRHSGSVGSRIGDHGDNSHRLSDHRLFRGRSPAEQLAAIDPRTSAVRSGAALNSYANARKERSRRRGPEYQSG